MSVQGRFGFGSTMALEVSMEWDWPGENLRRPQLDKFSVRRCDRRDLGTFDGLNRTRCGCATHHTRAFSHTRTLSHAVREGGKKNSRRDLAETHNWLDYSKFGWVGE